MRLLGAKLGELFNLELKFTNFFKAGPLICLIHFCLDDTHCLFLCQITFAVNVFKCKSHRKQLLSFLTYLFSSV